MTQVLQLAVTGLSNGAILALAALGFALIYKATGVINFAQGELLLIGAYMVYTGIVDFSLPWPLAILFAVAVAVIVGVVVERLILRPMIGQSPVAIIMVTIGLAEVIDPTTLSGSIKFGATVTIVDEDTDEEKTWQIVGEHEANIENGLLNIKSPIARALIGKEEGDSVEVRTPGGVRSYEVLTVDYV